MTYFDDFSAQESRALAIVADAVADDLMMSDSDMLMDSLHSGDGSFHMCGIAPRVKLTTVSDWECENCNAKLVRCFSGSGWYEDDALCAECGESVTGYRPFRPRWRKENIAKAQEWLALAVPLEEFRATTRRLIDSEMGWDTHLEDIE